MSARTIRLNELVQRELSAILRQRYQKESVAMTITEVRVAPDLRDARVFVAILGDLDTAEERMKWLRGQAKAIRKEISSRIILKYLPRFEYCLDRSSDRAVRLVQLIDEVEGKKS